ncbi:rod shape-determining protein MreD [Limosilactobacillus coleohominis]|uniref:rod shape-determining protein MreD n=1 Tax=Limosilactobacillus coleohominis TaxID=181675 RepID=UPI00195E4C01|nr:rod shape-determining protein MreD [Limosilactobacillus coleohominis]MBM6954417.1 rod shape-determining protein MreD [Limosilactobacillus coleohominis]
MYRLSRIRFLFPIGLFIAFFLDGSFSKVFANQFFSFPYTMVSQLVLLWLVLAYFFEADIKIPLYGFAVIVGALTDLYYAGVFGLFIVLYPLMVWVTKSLAGLFNENFFNTMIIFFIDVCVFQLLNYWAYLIIGIAHVNFGSFLLYTLAPTLALNLVYFVLLYWPINTLFTKALAKKRS